MTAPDVDRALAELLLQHQVEQFLYREADLLDDRRYREWLDLFAEDAEVWIPLERNVKFGEWDRELTRAEADIGWIWDDKGQLAQRVDQILTGVHWAEEPSSRVCHVVSAVRILACRPDPWNAQEVEAACRLLLYRNRQETEADLFAARRQDLLRRVEGEWRVVRRKVLLRQNVLLAKNLTMFF